MLTAANVSSEMAVNYFIKNYYHQGKSRWSGQGAEKLGLSGAVENQQAFKNVIEGRSPNGREQLNAKVLKTDERRAALDCTFSAPKSVSLMALVGGDERLIAAHHQALKKVLTLMEQRYAITRVTQGDSRHRVNTANLVVAEFDHIESRSLDPHLHTHCLVMNTTEASGKWMSLVNSEIFANKKFLGMAYQSSLATEVIKLGYEVEPRQHGQFEIKGFKEQDLEAFSKRRQQIIAAGASTTWAEREKVWDTTRQRKQKVTESELKSLWHEEAAALGINFSLPVEPNSFVQDSQEMQSLENALAEAIAHCSERNVAFKQEDLEKFILSERLFTDVTAIEPLIKQHQELIALPGVQLQYTTLSAVKRELATIELMQSGQSKVNPICSRKVIESQLEKTSLNSGQRQAVSLAATTTDQFIAWQGVAGAGKTFALKELNAIALGQGYTVKGFAPSSMAAKVLSEELGIHSETVASLLVGEPPKVAEVNQIWIVDEAGLLSAKDAHALLERATIEGARLLLVGDTKQLSAVEAGNPFKSLQQAGIKTAHLNESNRQRNPDLKIAVDLIADGRIEAGFKQLETIGSIYEVSPEAKLEMIASDYMALTSDQRQRTLVLAGTNVEKLALTQAIRGKLKVEGSLGKTANISQLQAKNLTLVQMRYTHNFELGDVVMPTRNYKRRGLEKGKVYEVVSKDLDRLILKTSAGTRLEVDTNFDKAVYQRDEIEIAVGDRLQWKKNDRQLQRRNGQEFIVTAIEGDSAQIEYKDTKTTETINLKQAQNLDYALVSTIYSSQGKTTDLALIAADYTIGQESFYVAISRARHNVKLYTKDKSELLELAQESKAKDNALELLMNSLKVERIQAKTASVSPRANEPVVKLEVAIAEPVLKAQPLVTEQVSLPVSQAAPLVTTSLETVAKPTLKEKRRDDRKSLAFEKPVLKTAVPTEAFWIPQKQEEVPNFIEPKHWQEFENSAIHPEIAALNFESLQFNYAGGEHEAWERLMVSEKLNRTNTGRLSEGLIKAYSHLDAGGWWCDAGVDARSFADLTPGDKPAIKRWGCYKPNTPRPKKNEENQVIEGKFIKYEHPPKVELSIFLLNVPEDIAERIYSKHKVNPTQQERKSGFWYCVWKYNLPCALAEGAKKAASLLSQGHITIGLPGISAGYRSPKDEFGKKIGKSYLHEELAVFATPSREIKFCFDYETKPETKLNIERDISVTGRLLQKAGARVKVVSLPGPSKGVDDFIVASGPLAYEKLSHEAMKLRDWQQHNQHSKVAAIEPPKLQLKESSLQQTSPNQPIGQTHDNQQQPNPDTITNREDRGVEPENRTIINQQPADERENRAVVNEPSRGTSRIESQSLEFLGLIKRYVDLEEVEQLRDDIARTNESPTIDGLRGERTTNLSTEANGQDSAIFDRKANYVYSSQPATGQLLNVISNYVEQSVIESALAETVLEVTQQLSQYKEQLVTAKTTFNDLDAVLANDLQSIIENRVISSISDYVEQSAIESALAETVLEVTQQLSQYKEQLITAKATFNDLDVVLANDLQSITENRVISSISDYVEQSAIESALAETILEVTQQLSQYKEQLVTAKTTFNDLDAVLANDLQSIIENRVISSISDYVEQSAIESALAETVLEVTQQLSQYKEQLITAKATFNDLDVVLANDLQSITENRVISSISDYVEQSAIESALAETILEVTQQLSQYKEQLITAKATFNDLDAVLANDLQSITENRVISSISDYVEQSAIESALAETVLEVTQQLSQYKEQLITAKATFNDLDAVLANDLQSITENRVISLSSDHVEQSVIESGLADETLLGHLKLHLKQIIQSLEREKLAEVVMEVGKYIKGEKVTGEKVNGLLTSVTDDAKALTFEQKMNIVRQLIRDDKPSIMKRLGINSPSPDDNEEHLRFRR
ncbi:MAG: relaxase domain-containing protein [Nostoc desertorum CM1-VF14]|jgi:conjugative relaxase-like TrwC/TraI family protein|nr:relaxase domain-containing protein [Nostoc desertorum CM1-VF14]